MIVERIWAANELRNYHYLIGCAETGEALLVDPLDAQACLKRASERGWKITQIVNTHEHRDHTDGNAEVVRATGAKVLAHAGAAARIGGVDRGLVAGDVIRVGRSATHSHMSACWRMVRRTRCFPATRCSTPAWATAGTAAIPSCSTPPVARC
jgi:glyoxylase-like metal-dependent hydrolase (beta-lactamase superfamily II)